MMSANLYDKEFYQLIRDTAGSSAKLVLQVLKENYHGEIHSAVDLGCGIGIWLKEIKEIFDKQARIRGYDGEYVDRKDLTINEEEFIPWDLNKKVRDENKYDIAISLEVAEHLSQSSADIFVEQLAKLSDIVLFSAALPYQNGAGHVNEQPLSYWVKKFDERDYEFFDVIRPYIWDNEKVSYWYRQNIVVFVRKNSEAILLMNKVDNKPVDIIHPELLRLKEMELHNANMHLSDCNKQIKILHQWILDLDEKRNS